MPAAQQSSSPQQINMQARQIVLARAVDEWQNISSNTYTNVPLGQAYNIPLRNVGLIKRLLVEVQAEINPTSGETQTLTALGGANFFSQIILTDLSNQQRVSTSSWHLTMVASAKARAAYGEAITASDTPFGFGLNYLSTQHAEAQLTSTTASNNTSLFFEVPLAYSDQDLRGALYANVVNATMYLQLTVNPNLFVAAGADASLAMYQSSNTTLATLTSLTLTIYQNYLDQIPIGKNGPVLPLIDLSTAYLLNNTTITSIVQNQDFPIPYANFRDFMSTTLLFDNGGTLSTGGDISYFAIQSANYTNIIKLDPWLVSLMARLRIKQDFPAGVYYFDHRNKPISTIQYGNMALIVNASTVNANAVYYMGYESLALINQVTQAGALPGN